MKEEENGLWERRKKKASRPIFLTAIIHGWEVVTIATSSILLKTFREATVTCSVYINREPAQRGSNRTAVLMYLRSSIILMLQLFTSLPSRFRCVVNNFEVSQLSIISQHIPRTPLIKILMLLLSRIQKLSKMPSDNSTMNINIKLPFNCQQR